MEFLAKLLVDNSSRIFSSAVFFVGVMNINLATLILIAIAELGCFLMLFDMFRELFFRSKSQNRVIVTD